MDVFNAHASGIDVGSREHWVAVDQDKSKVRKFGVYTSDHIEMIGWLKENDVRSIAMESTGSYWQTLFDALQQAGFEVDRRHHQRAHAQALESVLDTLLRGKLRRKEERRGEERKVGVSTAALLPQYHTGGKDIIKRACGMWYAACARALEVCKMGMRVLFGSDSCVKLTLTSPPIRAAVTISRV